MLILLALFASFDFFLVSTQSDDDEVRRQRRSPWDKSGFSQIVTQFQFGTCSEKRSKTKGDEPPIDRLCRGRERQAKQAAGSSEREAAGKQTSTRVEAGIASSLHTLYLLFVHFSIASLLITLEQ